MIWVAWRQQRLQILLSIVLIAVVAAVVFYFRLDAVEFLRSRGIDGCRVIDEGRCTPAAMNAFADRFKSYVGVIPLVLLCLPVLLGMFAGAPLFAREFEQGTHIFVLSQSVGRYRWWTTKLLLGGIPVVAAMVALGLVSSWALRPLSFVAHGRMMTPGFETQGLVIAAYAVLAFAIGATAGLLSRNTVAAMAATIGLYLVLLVGVVGVARDSYMEPESKSGAVAAGAVIGSQSGRSVVPDDARRLDTTYFDKAGAQVTFDPSSCLESDMNIEGCLGRQGIVSLTARFNPDSQFWGFQLIESAIFLAIALALLAVGGWALRRRLL
jgi:ABC-type transport system involved in multi-copper enzyme maturation permease subunit